MAPTPQTFKTRLHATSLAACPGWTDWALPKLQKLIHRTSESVLSDSALNAEEVMRLRAAYKALTKDFLDMLHIEAAAAFDTSLPVVHTDELDTTLPEPDIIAATLKMLQHEILVPAARPKPPPPEPETPAFDPFAGCPQPASTKAPPP